MALGEAQDRAGRTIKPSRAIRGRRIMGGEDKLAGGETNRQRMERVIATVRARRKAGQ